MTSIQQRRPHGCARWLRGALAAMTQADTLALPAEAWLIADQ
jgi:hypothetical protein